MARSVFGVVLILALSTALPGQGNARRAGNGPGGLKQIKTRDAPFSSKNVRSCVQAAREWLLSQQDDSGLWLYKSGFGRNASRVTQRDVGLTALCTYALLESGLTDRHEAIAKALKLLDKANLDYTYALALRANAFLAADKHGLRYRDELQRDRKLLLDACLRNGSYTYSITENRSRSGDNSNAQYGVLGIWAIQRAGRMEIPEGYWKLVLKHWLKSQNYDGGWSYRRVRTRRTTSSTSYPAMTAAGVATVYICVDNLYNQRFIHCRAGSDLIPVDKGIDWLAKNFHLITDPPKPRVHRPGRTFTIDRNRNGYVYYGLERVGLASGYKYFGKHDWYKEIASILLKNQQVSGAWQGGWHDGGEIGATAYSLLFLSRGQRPVAFNRLQYKGDWNNRPRALAHCCRDLSRRLEGDIHWQIINADVDVEQWHDAPILLLTGSKAPQFTPAQKQRLKQYVLQGGTILSIAECGGAAFSAAMRKLYQELFGRYEMSQCPDEHPIYTLQAPVRRAAVFHEIFNGVRPLVLHTDNDLTRPWQLNTTYTGKRFFDQAVNLLLYITDKGQLRNRAQTHWLAPVPVPDSRPIRVVRLSHAGNDNPEPLAWERFKRLMARDEGLRIEVSGPTSVDKLDGAHLAVLSGTAAFQMNRQQRGKLKEYIESGGTLLIEAMGGSDAFARSGQKLIDQLYGRPVQALSETDKLYRLPGREIKRLELRHGQVFQGSYPSLYTIRREDREVIYLSKHDLTSGLLGVPILRCEGYEPEAAKTLLRNLLLLSAGRTSKP